MTDLKDLSVIDQNRLKSFDLTQNKVSDSPIQKCETPIESNDFAQNSSDFINKNLIVK